MIRSNAMSHARGPIRHAGWLLLACVLSLLMAAPAQAQFNNTVPRADFAGHHNYQVTGGSLRRLPNGTSGDQDDDNNGIKDACEVMSSDTAILSGVPTDGNTSIAAAYLYWGGSGSTVDSTVRLNGVAVPVLQTFTENFNGAGYNLDYFGGVGDVTAIVQAAGINTSYTFSNLTVNTGGGGGSTDHCAPSAVVAGWALFVFYSDPDEPYRYSRIYDGLQYFRDATVTTNQSGFRVPNFKDGKVTVVTWEGDPDAESSVPGASGSTENLIFSTAFRTGNLPDPPNSCNVANQLYSSKISNNITGLCDTGSPGVDISTFDVTGFLDEGIEEASLVYSSGNDLVFLTAQVISTTNTPVVDLGITKTHSGSFTVGGSGSYQVVVRNHGPEIAVGDNTVSPAQYTTVTDTLPAGVTLTSYTGSGWSCSTAGQLVTCVNQADIQPDTNLPTLTLNVDISEAAIGTVNNTAVVTHPMFDSNPANNSSTDTVEVPNPAPPSSGNKQLYLRTGPVNGNLDLTRTRPATSGTMTWASGDGQYQYFRLPALAGDLALNSANVSVQLRGRRSGNSGTRRVRAQLFLNGTGAGNAISGDSADMNFNVSSYTTRTVGLTLNRTTFDAGDQIILRVQNRDNRDVQLIERDGAVYSFVTLDAATVINVDSVGFFSAQYPSIAQKPNWEPGETVYIRAEVSDPFGGFDVSATNSTLTLADADGGPLILNGVALTPRTSPTEGDGVPNRILEYAYTLPASPSFGSWTATVTASEGLENAITHSRNAAFQVVPKALDVTKSHVGDFIAGSENSYTLLVSNGGAAIAAGTTTTVKDTLAPGLSFVSGTGTGWSCSAAGQEVTCSSTAAIPAGGNMAPITLTVLVSGSVGGSVENQASVGNTSVGGGYQKPGNVDTATVLHPDLSQSSKSVSDPNGEDVTPGEPLVYTITLKESAGVEARNVSVTDDLPANTTALALVSAPPGSVDASTGSHLAISGITVPANGTATIVFQVTVDNVAPGSTIENMATVTNPGGPGANPQSAQMVVLQSQVAPPAEGSKFLYLLDSGPALTRDRDLTGTGTTPGVNIGASATQVWTLGPELAADLTINGNVSVNLRAECTGGFWCGFLPGSLTAELWYNNVQVGATSGAQSVSSTSVTTVGLSIPVTTPHAITRVNGAAFELRIRNGGISGVRVYEYNGDRSTASFLTSTVVNVDSVAIHSVPQSVGNDQKAYYVEGDTLYIRAVASDPFGAADITAATLELTDAQGNKVVDGAAMGVVASTAATKTFEYAYAVPANPRIGAWTAKVTAIEGRETDPVISHHGSQLASVHGLVTLTKVWVNAADGHAVDLSISGGSSATAGSAVVTTPVTPPTPAEATAAPGATLTLTETFTSGSSVNYAKALTCTKASDSSAIPVTGTGASRSITMPDDSAVACVWTNTWMDPLTVVKASAVAWDPVNGFNNPKAIPGALVEYQITVINPAVGPIDADTLFVTDALPENVALRLDFDTPGSGPVSFTEGGGPSGLGYTFTSLASNTDDIAFSNDGGTTWNYVPVADAEGFDPAVDAIRINPKGAFEGGGGQFTLKFRVKVQ